jgi:hypothetical protein
MLFVELQQVLLLRRQQVIHKNLLISQFLQNLPHIHLLIKLAHAGSDDLLGNFIMLIVKAAHKPLVLLNLDVIALSTANFVYCIIVASLYYLTFNFNVRKVASFTCLIIKDSAILFCL